MDMLNSVRTEKDEDKVGDIEWHSEVSARTYRVPGIYEDLSLRIPSCNL